MTRTRMAALAAVFLGNVSLPLHAGQPQPPQAPSVGEQSAGIGARPEVFGTTSTAYVTIPQWKFTPAFSAWTYGDTAGNQPLRYINVAGQSWLLASPELPSGAVLQYLELDYCNTNLTNPLTLNLYQTDYQNLVELTLASLTGDPNSGCTYRWVDLSGFGITVDNVNKRYVFYAIFAGNADATTALAGAIIGYRLQVSPAPGAATFLDVPTGHPQFQFIEALVAAGITAGCGGSNYCPDASLTRGQMAVFLSKALGLHFF